MMNNTIHNRKNKSPPAVFTGNKQGKAFDRFTFLKSLKVQRVSFTTLKDNSETINLKVMKKFFIESRMLGKSLSLTLILLLAVNCQTDESADIGIKENLPTEGIDAQSQARAREIVNSEEYENAMNQMEMFISKVNDEHFFYRRAF